nr:right-handed parallel beta-helix repeat-containing protein [Terriglobales bacterium]
PGTSAVTVTQSVVQNYQKNGITANEAGTTATITSNNITGIGATPAIAQNGIQIAYGAGGTISANDVSDDVYTGGFYGSAGILVYASANVSITSNTVSNTQYGITVDSDPDLGAADNAIVNANRISSTRNFDAIDLCSDHDTAKNNTLSASDEAGIHIDSLCQSPGGNPTGNNDTVTNNSINVACTGILLGLGTGNTTTPNNYFNVPTLTLSGDSCTPPPGSGKPGRGGKRAVKPARL